MSALRVHYPSGKTFTVDGELGLSPLPNGQGIAPIVDDGQRVLVLDPRALVLRDGTVVADPRSIARAAHAPWVRAWLDEHSEWPRVATEATP
jgi:hypothetical protein